MASFKNDVVNTASSSSGLPADYISVLTLAPGSVIATLQANFPSSLFTADQSNQAVNYMVSSAGSAFSPQFLSSYGCTSVAASSGQSPQSSSSTNLAAIIAGVVGGSVLIALVAILIVVLKKKRKNNFENKVTPAPSRAASMASLRSPGSRSQQSRPASLASIVIDSPQSPMSKPSRFAIEAGEIPPPQGWLAGPLPPSSPSDGTKGPVLVELGSSPKKPDPSLTRLESKSFSRSRTLPPLVPKLYQVKSSDPTQSPSLPLLPVMAVTAAGPSPSRDAKAAWKKLAEKEELGLKSLMTDKVSKRRVKTLLKKLKSLEERKAQETAEAEKAVAKIESKSDHHSLGSILRGLQGEGKIFESEFFNLRAKETESQAIMDSAAVLEHRFVNDWNGINKKDAFRTMMEQAIKKYEELVGHQKIKKVVEPPITERLADVRQVVSKHQAELRSLFCYYSALLLPEGPMENDRIQRMDCDAWIKFCDLMGLTSITHDELVDIFIATNDAAAVLAMKASFKGRRGPAGARPVDVDDASLSRGEFYEALLRVGFLSLEKTLRSNVGTAPNEASEAIDSFLSSLISKAPAAAVEDPDSFRSKSLYTKEMEKTIKDHWDVLTASYNVFRSTQPRGGGVLFELETWETMLKNLDLMAQADEEGSSQAKWKVDRATAIHIFQSSQMALTDELSNRGRLSEISKWEFAEALSRLADHLKLGDASGSGARRAKWQEGQLAGPGADLAKHFDVLMDHIVDCLGRNFGFFAGDDDDEGDDADDFDLDEEDKQEYVPHLKNPVPMPDCLEDDPTPTALEPEQEDGREFDELFGEEGAQEGAGDAKGEGEGDFENAEIEFDRNTADSTTKF